MDSPIKKSGIPIPRQAKSALMRRLNKSTDSNLDQIDDLEEFTLREENIELKEEKQRLIKKITETVQKNLELEQENKRIKKQLDEIKSNQLLLQEQFQQMTAKFQREIEEGVKIQTIQEDQKKTINDLMKRIHEQEVQRAEIIEASKEAKLQLEELVPGVKTSTDDPVNIGETATIEQLFNDIGSIKIHLNNTELQLFEAHEKITELVEQQAILEQENEHLKAKNTEFENSAQLVTTRLTENANTNKKWELAYMQLKLRYENLIRSSKDRVDSPPVNKSVPTTPNGNPIISNSKPAIISQLSTESNIKNETSTNNKRIVEMTNRLVIPSIETNHIDEIKILKAKLTQMETELHATILRAKIAETEIERLKDLSSNVQNNLIILDNSEQHIDRLNNRLHNNIDTESPVPPPPPPPPPPPLIHLVPVAPAFGSLNTDSGQGLGLNDGIGNTYNKLIPRKNQQVGRIATGMDALMKELRNRTVRLRRNKAKPKNPVLEEMYDVLEKSRAENRKSQILVDTQLIELEAAEHV